MSSYFSSITSSSAISNLGTRLNSLRRAITSDEADDPENEDCSHISNVLRAYYTEKGRRFPAWLPPDPKDRSPAPSRVIATSNNVSSASVSSGRGGGLGDLWGDSGSGAAGGPPQPATSSLRRGRGQPGSNAASPSIHSSAMSASSFHPAGGRPMPGERSGSYQSVTSAGSGSSAGLERATSAQERLRARLHGGRSPSPGQLSDPSMRRPVGASPGSGRLR
ncbi:uncharacterized protein DSM5745_04187 [Aspergillus mulundensis]|uniref:Mso1 N-terminal domain-containing protein n=1 Tax=Aspergillus mulundensis TaxID=1810919 RepID=A0A3D8SCH8_9EURO|nr:Uncharacterized protein DSM5745_04187 [Aspergillus mulundensis]RDW83861.1 Uncharacterized protein DSM5745_04187 [Aspergillus mulundensis]